MARLILGRPRLRCKGLTYLSVGGATTYNESRLGLDRAAQSPVDLRALDSTALGDALTAAVSPLPWQAPIGACSWWRPGRVRIGNACGVLRANLAKCPIFRAGETGIICRQKGAVESTRTAVACSFYGGVTTLLRQVGRPSSVTSLYSV